MEENENQMADNMTTDRGMLSKESEGREITDDALLKTNNMNIEKSIEVLNTLIEIINDRITGYETAGEEAEEPDLKLLFSQFAKTSRKFKEELVTEIQKLGGIPTQETKAEGKVFRAWMEFKTVVTAHHSVCLQTKVNF